MATIKVSVLVQRPIEEVFRYIKDFDLHPEWRTSLLEAKMTSDGPVAVGSTYRYSLKVGGRKVETSGVVMEYQAPHVFAWKTTSGPFPMSGLTSCEETPDGIRVSETIEAEPGGFFKLAEPILVRQQKSQMEIELQALKNLLEENSQ